MLKRILRGVGFALAILILLLEDAVWVLFRPIAGALARLELVGRAEIWIRRQPPWLTAILFLVPLAIVYPIKILGLALIGFGRPRIGLALLIAAEIFGTLLLAWLWTIGRNKLMTIAWLAWAYGWIDGFRQRVYGWVRRQPVWLFTRSTIDRIRDRMGVWLQP